MQVPTLEATTSPAGQLAEDAGIGAALPLRVDPEPRRRDLRARLCAMSLAGVGHGRDRDRDADAEEAAAARAWLALIDAGRAAASWSVAAPALREGISPGEWELALRSVRTPLGPCRSRSLRSRTIVEACPGVPSGRYSVVRFESAFDGRDGVVETVTTCLGDDGRWRVAAYFLR